MGEDRPDPLWAIRWVKRAFWTLAGLVALVVLLVVAWWLLPVAPAELELRLTTNAEVTLGDSSLGSGEIFLDDSALREHGVVVNANTELHEIAARIFPGEEFRGQFGHSPQSLPMIPDGVQCHLRSGETWRVVRIFVFPIEDEQWLALPISFRDEQGRVHTAGSGARTDIGWVLERNLVKRPTHEKVAVVTTVDDEPPGEGMSTWHFGFELAVPIG
jgi:hypothetical protein